MYAAQYFPQISELLRRLPRVILLMLKTNDCLRALNHALVCHASSSSSFLLYIKKNELNIEPLNTGGWVSRGVLLDNRKSLI